MPAILSASTAPAAPAAHLLLLVAAWSTIVQQSQATARASSSGEGDTTSPATWVPFYQKRPKVFASEVIAAITCPISKAVPQSGADTTYVYGSNCDPKLPKTRSRVVSRVAYSAWWSANKGRKWWRGSDQWAIAKAVGRGWDELSPDGRAEYEPPDTLPFEQDHVLWNLGIPDPHSPYFPHDLVRASCGSLPDNWRRRRTPASEDDDDYDPDEPMDQTVFVRGHRMDRSVQYRDHPPGLWHANDELSGINPADVPHGENVEELMRRSNVPGPAQIYKDLIEKFNKQGDGVTESFAVGGVNRDPQRFVRLVLKGQGAGPYAAMLKPFLEDDVNVPPAPGARTTPCTPMNNATGSTNWSASGAVGLVGMMGQSARDIMRRARELRFGGGRISEPVPVSNGTAPVSGGDNEGNPQQVEPPAAAPGTVDEGAAPNPTSPAEVEAEAPTFPHPSELQYQGKETWRNFASDGALSPEAFYEWLDAGGGADTPGFREGKPSLICPIGFEPLKDPVRPRGSVVTDCMERSALLRHFNTPGRGDKHPLSNAPLERGRQMEDCEDLKTEIDAIESGALVYNDKGKVVYRSPTYGSGNTGRDNWKNFRSQGGVSPTEFLDIAESMTLPVGFREGLPSLQCSIMHDLMVDPVRPRGAMGYECYEREVLERWIEERGWKNPLTNAPIRSHALDPCTDILEELEMLRAGELVYDKNGVELFNARREPRRRYLLEEHFPRVVIGVSAGLCFWVLIGVVALWRVVARMCSDENEGSKLGLGMDSADPGMVAGDLGHHREEQGSAATGGGVESSTRTAICVHDGKTRWTRSSLPPPLPLAQCRTYTDFLRYEAQKALEFYPLPKQYASTLDDAASRNNNANIMPEDDIIHTPSKSSQEHPTSDEQQPLLSDQHDYQKEKDSSETRPSPSLQELIRTEHLNLRSLADRIMRHDAATLRDTQYTLAAASPDEDSEDDHDDMVMPAEGKSGVIFSDTAKPDENVNAFLAALRGNCRSSNSYPSTFANAFTAVMTNKKNNSSWNFLDGLKAAQSGSVTTAPAEDSNIYKPTQQGTQSEAGEDALAATKPPQAVEENVNDENKGNTAATSGVSSSTHQPHNLSLADARALFGTAAIGGRRFDPSILMRLAVPVGDSTNAETTSDSAAAGGNVPLPSVSNMPHGECSGGANNAWTGQQQASLLQQQQAPLQFRPTVTASAQPQAQPAASMLRQTQAVEPRSIPPTTGKDGAEIKPDDMILAQHRADAHFYVEYEYPRKDNMCCGGLGWKFLLALSVIAAYACVAWYAVVVLQRTWAFQTEFEQTARNTRNISFHPNFPYGYDVWRGYTRNPT